METEGPAEDRVELYNDDMENLDLSREDSRFKNEWRRRNTGQSATSGPPGKRVSE